MDAPEVQMRRFLTLLYAQGDVFEVRAPKCADKPGGRFRSTTSGCYQYERLDLAIRDILALDRAGRAPGVYCTLNPVRPDLLARSNNTLKDRVEHAAGDLDIVCRRWLLVDCDPARPAGISSTEHELELAQTRARLIRQALSARGWPEPIQIMSGNGHHLLYRINLPANDGGLVERVLKALAAQFGDEVVGIDTSVGNAARITKIPGTIARKGDAVVGVQGIDDRPHRRAQLLDVPTLNIVVPEALLDSLASQAAHVESSSPARAAARAPGQGPGGFARFDHTPSGVRGYLEGHGVGVKGEKREGSSTLLFLEQCPVDPSCASENSSDIAVVIHESGKIVYKNLHNRGHGRRWLDVREALEPGYRAHAAAAKHQDRTPSSAKARPRPCTDLGNAERLVERFGDDLRYCPALSRWLTWNGMVWAPDLSGVVERCAAKTARSIYKEAAQHRTSSSELAKWAVRSEGRQRLEAMIGVARSDLRVVVLPSDLDRDRWLFNCKNGTIDLTTGRLRPHSRRDLITRLAPVAVDFDTPTPLWSAFLSRIFDGDAELIGFVQRFLGMSLSGDISEQYLPIFFGDGGNGKSVLLDTVAGLMGDYAALAPPDLLVESKGREHPTAIADLFGRRLVIASETEHGCVLRLQLVKRLTGDARLKGRLMRQDFVEAERTHKMVLVTNNLPVIHENTEAVRRRLLPVPFRVVIPERERDPGLARKLRAEWPGITASLVRGCVEWRRDGLGVPGAVRREAARYIAGADHVERFVRDRCRLGANCWVSSEALRSGYRQWCEGSNERPLADCSLLDRLRRLGFIPRKQAGERGWCGLEFRRENALDAVDAVDASLT